MFNLFSILIDMFCYVFVVYYLGRVAIETHRDLRGKAYSFRQYWRKFAKQFWHNLTYSLP